MVAASMVVGMAMDVAAMVATDVEAMRDTVVVSVAVMRVLVVSVAEASMAVAVVSTAVAADRTAAADIAKLHRIFRGERLAFGSAAFLWAEE
jgi:hypothetical protein